MPLAGLPSGHLKLVQSQRTVDGFEGMSLTVRALLVSPDAG